MNKEDLSLALGRVAQNPRWREEFVRMVVAFEKHIATPDLDVRELVSGPLIDAVFDQNEVARKRLSNGILLDFYYRSKIARDFIMSSPEQPTHAWEPQTTRLVVNLAAQAKQVVIGGAYFGDHAILIAQQVAKNQGLVHAFEPNDDQRNMLIHNASINDLHNIIARPEGLWDDSSSTLKLVGDDSFAHPESVAAETAGGFSTTTIDDYLRAAQVTQVDLIMLDIEGAEERVLKGATHYLKQPAGVAPHIVFEVHRHYVDWSAGLSNTEIVQLLQSHGYTVFAVRDFNSNVDLSNRPIELIPMESVYLEGPPHGFNMLAIKDDSIIASREYRICRDVSPKLLRHKSPRLHHPTEGL